ncbi:MAG: hypothetical protein WBM02_11630 [bacterium]
MENNKTKKGLGPLAWVGIGCGIIVLIIIIVTVAGGLFIAGKVKDTADDFKKNPELAAARLIVKTNPDLEEVAYDEKKGTITFRNKDTDETITASFADIKDGKFSIQGKGGESVVFESSEEDEGHSMKITTGEGSYEIAAGDTGRKAPDWIPLPDNPALEDYYSMKSDNNESGSFSFNSERSMKEIVEFYKQAFEANGYQTSTYSVSDDENEGAGVVGDNEDQNLNIKVAIEEKDGHRYVSIIYTRNL